MTLLINGEKVDQSLIQEEYERLRPHYEEVFREQTPQEQKKQLMEWSRENVIERILITQEAKRNGPEIKPDEIDKALDEIKKQQQDSQKLTSQQEKRLRGQIEQQMKMERLLNDACKDIGQPTEKDVSAYYEGNKEQFKEPEQIRVSHIVKHLSWQTDEKTAQEVILKAREELNNGAIFEMLVSKYSDCPDNGGDLGYIIRGQMVEEFEDVVFNLGTNQISDVFRTRYGFHIAKVNDRKPAKIPPLDKVREQITEKLKEQMSKDAVDSFIDKLREKAKIEQI